ncbi:MAG: lysophospholipid acyltransferase family protein [Micrococcaceae bacterium]
MASDTHQHSSMKKRNAVFRSIATIGRGVSHVAVKHHWSGLENLPQDGAFIVCPNHMTNADPVAIMHMLYSNGYTAQFLVKGALFKNKALAYILNKAQQIPVYRDSDPSKSLEAAKIAISEGGVVVMYPEGTFTRDPQRWPMKGKTGAARLALETGVPVVPIAHWGLLDFMPIGTAKVSTKRPDITILVGKPLTFDEYRGKEITKELLDEVTNKIMDAITELLEELRGEKAPEHRWDMKVDGDTIISDQGKIVTKGVNKDS